MDLGYMQLQVLYHNSGSTPTKQGARGVVEKRPTEQRRALDRGQGVPAGGLPTLFGFLEVQQLANTVINSFLKYGNGSKLLRSISHARHFTSSTTLARVPLRHVRHRDLLSYVPFLL